MAKTSLPTDQITIFSSKTGLHNLDTYIEAIEKGSRTLPDLLDDLFDETGTLIADIEMRYNAGALEYRYGIFVDPEAGWVNIATFNKWQGIYTAGNNYNEGDVVEYQNGVIYFVDAYTNVPLTPDPDLDPKLIWIIDDAYVSDKLNTMQTLKSDTQAIKDLAVTDTQAIANQASTSATNAATSATNAATSETNASTFASNASASETNAATSATNAATSATNASASETNAATSATNASTSATNASTSAVNALASEQTTQALYDDLNIPLDVTPLAESEYTESFIASESRSGLLIDPETGVDIVYADNIIYFLEYNDNYIFFSSNNDGASFNEQTLDGDFISGSTPAMAISLDVNNMPGYNYVNSSGLTENYTYKISKFRLLGVSKPTLMHLAVIFYHSSMGLSKSNESKITNNEASIIDHESRIASNENLFTNGRTPTLVWQGSLDNLSEAAIQSYSGHTIRPGIYICEINAGNAIHEFGHLYMYDKSYNHSGFINLFSQTGASEFRWLTSNSEFRASTRLFTNGTYAARSIKSLRYLPL